jgi:hypothetical protein
MNTVSPYGAVITAPVNAPGAPPLQIGVQAGTLGPVIEAFIVIIFGTGGGIFVYNGTPAAGTLVGSWAAQAGSDQFGNTYPIGISLGLTSNTLIQLRPDKNALLMYSS